MSQQALNDTVASIQQILDRDYAHLERRVLASQPASSELPDEPLVYVHARTRDFRHHSHVARAWTTVAAAPTLQLSVAEVAAEAEQSVADQSAADPTS